MTITLNRIAEWTQGRLVAGDPELEIRGFSTDSRTLKKGQIFVALRGSNFDGHSYLAQAFCKGACGAVVEHEDALHGWPGVMVPDTLAALGTMAHRYRWEVCLIPWVAITGSNGKTTTREMLRQILDSRGPVAVSPRNYNNLVGLPLSILRAPKDAWVGILEMGTSEPGEIARLTTIATPTVAMVTSIGPAHLEGLGTHAAVAEEKGAIFDLLPHDGMAIYPANAPHADILRRHVPGRCATFAVEAPADMVAEDVNLGTDGVSFRVRGIKIEMSLLGRHNISNCLAALLAAEHLGVGLEDAATSLRRMTPVNDRLEVIETEHFTVLNDVYNANPASLRAAVEVMDAFDPALRRVVVVGDMLELGPDSRALHREAGQFLAAKGIDVILAIGKEAVALAEGAASASAKCLVRHFRTVPSILRKDERYVQPGDLILVKGSRGMHMEQVVKALKEWLPPSDAEWSRT